MRSLCLKFLCVDSRTRYPCNRPPPRFLTIPPHACSRAVSAPARPVSVSVPRACEITLGNRSYTTLTTRHQNEHQTPQTSTNRPAHPEKKQRPLKRVTHKTNESETNPPPTRLDRPKRTDTRPQQKRVTHPRTTAQTSVKPGKSTRIAEKREKKSESSQT